MKKGDGWIGVVILLAFFALCVWAAFHDAKSREAIPVLQQSSRRAAANQSKLAAIFAKYEIDHALIERPGEDPIVVIRDAKESDLEFVLRVDDARTGRIKALNLLCVTLQCGTETVQLCVACLVGETQQHCQERLDGLHATYCDLHPGCTPCP